MSTVRALDLDTLNLTAGGHRDPESGLCLLEAAAYLAGEEHSDCPACVSGVLGTFGRALNDLLPDDKRQQLKAHLPAMLGTSGDGLDSQRSYLALDWLVRTCAPAWFDLAGLSAEAAELRALRRIVDSVTAQAAGPVVRAGRGKAVAAGAAASADVEAAAWAAACAAAAGSAAGAAWAAAAAAGGTAAGAAWNAVEGAARAAARTTLKPTVEELQDSAIDLFGRMVRPAAEAATR